MSKVSRASEPVLKLTAKTALSFYRSALSPHIGGGCRYYPSCSTYAIEAFDRHDFWTATSLTAKRLSKCHPFGGSGYDPVPTEKEYAK